MGQFDWLDRTAVGASYTSADSSLFVDWRRNEPNNMTVSNGTATPGGERCVQLVPWQQDPLIIEQGAWNDDACQNERSFICQAFSPTTRYSLTISNATYIVAGTLIGGEIFSKGPTIIENLSILRSAAIHFEAQNHISRVRYLILMDSSKVYVEAPVAIFGSGFIGEMSVDEYQYLLGVYDVNQALYAQSRILVSGNGTLSSTCLTNLHANPNVKVLGTGQCSTSGEVSLDAEVRVDGGVIAVGNYSSLNLYQVMSNGIISEATFNVVDLLMFCVQLGWRYVQFAPDSGI